MKKKEENFLKAVNQKADTEIEKCYQCGKCASGCPVMEFFDYTPYGVLRLVLQNKKKKALCNSTIWLCASCYTCMTRCPNDIKITKVLDVLKEIAITEGVKTKQRDLRIFHKSFLNDIKKGGRINEFRLVSNLKMKTFKFFSDLGLGMKMFKKGKFVFKPEKIKGIDKLKGLFK